MSLQAIKPAKPRQHLVRHIHSASVVGGGIVWYPGRQDPPYSDLYKTPTNTTHDALNSKSKTQTNTNRATGKRPNPRNTKAEATNSGVPGTTGEMGKAHWPYIGNPYVNLETENPKPSKPLPNPRRQEMQNTNKA